MRKITALAAGSVLSLGLLVILVTTLVLSPDTVFADGNNGSTTLLAGAQQTATVDPGRTPTPGTPAPAPTPTPMPTPTPRRGTLTVSPSSATAGTPITVAGVGFSANALIAVAVESANGVVATYVQPSVDASGGFAVRLDSTGYAPGQYTVFVLALPNADRLAEATFTIAGTPGLPNTGQGAAASQVAWWHLLLSGAAIMALLSTAAIMLRRRA